MKEIVKVPNMPSNRCFACGEANVIGLQLEFFSDGETVFTKKYIPEKYAGWEKLIHGGILSTIADEVMAWTGIFLTKKYILTKGFQIEFLKPLYVEQEIHAIGKINDWIHEKEISVEVEIFSEKGELAVKTKGNLVLFTQDSIRKRNMFDENYLSKFEKAVFLNN